MTNVPAVADVVELTWQLVRQVPPGSVATYGDIARLLGDPVASRFVGHLMLHHRHTSACVCHRLVRADGALGRYITGNISEKASRLLAEGVTVIGHQVVPLETFRCTNLQGRPLLAELAQQQREVGEAAQATDSPPIAKGPNSIAGVDVSYVSHSNRAVAAYVEWSPPNDDSRDLVADFLLLHVQPVRFPYITSYLAFRELDIYYGLLQRVAKQRRLADVILVDGSGQLHPRLAGIATMLGASLDVPTVGVTKKRLAGRGMGNGEAHRVVGNRSRPTGETCKIVPLEHGGAQRGWEIYTGPSHPKPIFVSPGWRMDVRTSAEIVAGCLVGKRLPAPIWLADRLSRQRARELSAPGDVG